MADPPVVHGRVRARSRAGSVDGYAVRVALTRAIGADDGALEVPETGSARLDESGDFRIELTGLGAPRGPVTVSVSAPQGLEVFREEYGLQQLAKSLRIPVRTPPRIVVEPSDDPTLGSRTRLTGQVVDKRGRAVPAELAVVIWGVDRPNGSRPSERPLVVTQTQLGGKFTGEWVSDQLARAYGTIAGGKPLEVPLEPDRRLPRNVLLAVDLDEIGAAGDDCDCHGEAATPWAPEPADLANNPEAFTQDLGGGCIDLTMPNRALEEFSYLMAVRTTEPRVQGLAIDTRVTVPPALMSDLLGVSIASQAMGLIRSRPVELRTASLALDVGAARSLVRVDTPPTVAEIAQASWLSEVSYTGGLIEAGLEIAPGRSVLDADHPIDWDYTPTVYLAHRPRPRSPPPLQAGLAGRRVLAREAPPLASPGSRPAPPARRGRLGSAHEVGTGGAARVRRAPRRPPHARPRRARAGQLEAGRGRVRRVAQHDLGRRRRHRRRIHRAGLGHLRRRRGRLQRVELERLAGLRAHLLGRLDAAAARPGLAASLVAAERAHGGRADAWARARASGPRPRSSPTTTAATRSRSSTSRCCGTSSSPTSWPTSGSACSSRSRSRCSTAAKALRWREPLTRFLKHERLRGGFAAIERIADDWVGWDFPESAYSEEAPESIEGELRISFLLPRPRDDDDGAFQIDTWAALAPFIDVDPLELFTAKLNAFAARQRDRVFRDEIAPGIAEQLAQRLRLAFVTSDGGEVEVPVDATLVSRYAEGDAALRLAQPGRRGSRRSRERTSSTSSSGTTASRCHPTPA